MTGRAATSIMGTSVVLLLSVACHKSAPPARLPPSPNVNSGKPIIDYFSAEPATVNSGFAANLRWSVSNATSVQIDHGIGQVAPTGKRDVSPTDTSQYTLRASNATDTVMASVVVTVTKPPPRVESSGARMSRAEALVTKLQDVHFDYNSDNVSVTDQPILERDAAALKDLFEIDPGVSITIEGHCDERGSAEYNLALGDRRANAVRQALIKSSLPGEKLKVASFGKERLLCADETEACYARNRRVHFSLAQ